MAKQIEVRCPPQIGTLIIDALKWFVERNYPRGADECSIAAREALLDLAARFERDLLGSGSASYSSRLRAFVCEAVKGYLALQEQQTGQRYASRSEVVVGVCRGLQDGAGFAAATERDMADTGRSPPAQ